MKNIESKSVSTLQKLCERIYDKLKSELSYDTMTFVYDLVQMEVELTRREEQVK